MDHFFYILLNKHLLNIYSVQGTMPSIIEYKKKSQIILSSVQLEKDTQENDF